MTFSLLKNSRMSPSFSSSKPSREMPQSRPFFTSCTSSLKRLRLLSAALEEDFLAALDADLVRLLDLAFGDEGTGDDGLADLEELADLGLALDGFLLGGVQQADHGLLRSLR